MTALTLVSVVIFGALGGLLGATYFTALEWNVQLYTGGSGKKALLLHLLRFIGAVTIFTLCARAGAAPLLSSFTTFLIARMVVLNRNRIALESHP
jgi:F1F0 ATPase subunit 2